MRSLLVHVCLGFDGQRTGLCSAWTILRGRMSSPGAGVERETDGRAQQGHTRGDRETDNVSPTSYACVE